jgi:Cu/Ag efflux pump CusA
MAMVILCGLTTSTLLNMLVVPTLYLKYGEPIPAKATVADYVALRP